MIGDEVKLFVFEQELMTVNDTLEEIKYYHRMALAPLRINPLEDRKKKLESEIEKIQARWAHIRQENLDTIARELQENPIGQKTRRLLTEEEMKL